MSGGPTVALIEKRDGTKGARYAGIDRAPSVTTIGGTLNQSAFADGDDGVTGEGGVE